MTRALAPVLAACAALTFAVAPAQADFGFAGTPAILVRDAGGASFARAGGHPDRVEIAVAFNAVDDDADGNLKDVEFDFPPGFSGDPTAVPTCSRRVFEMGGVDPDEECALESQVGTTTVRFKNGDTVVENDARLFNIEAAPDELAVVGFKLFGKVPLTMRLRPDDFGVTVAQHDAGQTIPLLRIKVRLWGVPADRQTGTDISRRPFLTLPSRCDRGPLAVTVRARSWQQPDETVSATVDTGTPLTGCDDLPFEPTMSFALSDPAADSPSGATLGMDVPQSGDPEGTGSLPVERVRLALPEGVAVSPGVVNGLTTCADGALQLGADTPAACPSSARVGTIELSAPQLRQPLEGGIYFGQEHPGERFRLFFVAEGMGVRAKFVGALDVDPDSGRITATLDRLPEIAFSHIELRFDGGPRALLATPLECGKLTATGRFEAGGQPRVVTDADEVTIERGAQGGACLEPPFAPAFVGGTASAQAGRTSSLSLTLRRQSGEQLPDRFTTVLPSGLGAGVGSAEVCEGAAVGSCPIESRVGSAVAEVGSGSSLARLGGDVYLTGRYRRAPFGLAIVFHAALGPFDLGTLVTRAALRIDSESGRASVETDSLPRFVEGIPIRFRTIGLDIDRPGFIRTPTSCAPASIDAVIRSAAGASTTVSTPYVVRGCDRLRFAPRFSMGLTGRSEMRAGGHPGLRIGIRSRGGANLRSADIALPDSLRQSTAGLRSICGRQDAREARCPDSTRVGRARGETSLVSKPLTGPVHVVQPEGSGPPEVWTSLAAEGVRLEVRGKLLIRGGRVHTKLIDLPDLPISALVMRLAGGQRGLVSLAAAPCADDARHMRARVAFEGQNSAYLIAHEKIGHPGCGQPSSAREGDESGREAARRG